MKLTILFLKADPKFFPEQENQIKEVIQEHAEKAAQVLSIDSMVNITVYPSSHSVISETGDGGYTPSGDWIQISIDPERPLEEILEKHLPGTIYHEMNHIARWNSVGYGTDLLDALVSEGLGTVFEKEMWAETKPLWGTYDSAEITQLLVLTQLREKEQDKFYNHEEWFFGANQKYPRWLGYKVGTHIVEKALKNNPELKSADLITKTTEEIITLSNLDI